VFKEVKTKNTFAKASVFKWGISLPVGRQAQLARASRENTREGQRLIEKSIIVLNK